MADEKKACRMYDLTTGGKIGVAMAAISSIQPSGKGTEISMMNGTKFNVQTSFDTVRKHVNN